MKIFDPTTLLMASVLLSTKDAVTLTAVSGSDVPIATIVNPIIMDGTASFFARLSFPPQKNPLPLLKVQILLQEAELQRKAVHC